MPVNSAGFGHLGVFEESTRAEIRAQFETNVFGLMAVTQALIPGMRERRSGRIFEWAQNSIKAFQAQIDEWRELSVSTDGDWK